MRFVLLIALLWGRLVAAQPTPPTGDEIARKVNERDEGQTVARTLTMQQIDKNGGVREQVVRGFRKTSATEKSTVLFYQSPANLKGTAFLTIDYVEKGKDDDQWLYLPAARKVRRISASDRGEYFLGTVFSYEDLKNDAKVNFDDYTRTTVGEEDVDGHRCWVVEAVPVSDKVKAELRYSRVRIWADAESWIPRQFEIWDEAGNPLKTVRFKDIRQVQGIWTVHIIEGERHKDGYRSVFTFEDVDYQGSLKDELFTPNALERGF